MDFLRWLKSLNRDNLAAIETAYYDVLETDADSFGNHWILMAVLGQHGMRTSSPAEAMRVAERAIVEWYTLGKS